MKRNSTVGRALSFLFGFVLILAIIPAISFAEWVGGEWVWVGNSIEAWVGGEWEWSDETPSDAASKPGAPPILTDENDSPNGKSVAGSGGEWVFRNAVWKEIGAMAEPAGARPADPALGSDITLMMHEDGAFFWNAATLRDYDYDSDERVTVTFDANGGYFGSDRDDHISRTTLAKGERLNNFPSSPRRSGYDFDGWETSTGRSVSSSFRVTRDITVYADWSRDYGHDRYDRYDRYDRDDDWGWYRYDRDRDYDRYRSPTPRYKSGPSRITPTPASNVTSSGAVNPNVLLSEARAALVNAETVATVGTRNATSVSVAALRSLADAASGANKAIMYHADTLSKNGREVEARLYIDPPAFYTAEGNLEIGVSTTNADARAAESIFERSFSREVAVVSCAQEGAFGVSVHIAAMADLSGLNTASLVFYSYDRSSHQYNPIDSPSYSIDLNGFLHFYTSAAGDIIITDSPLVR